MNIEQEQADGQGQTELPDPARASDDGPRATGGGYDDGDAYAAGRDFDGFFFEEAEMAENGLATDTGYHLW